MHSFFCQGPFLLIQRNRSGIMEFPSYMGPTVTMGDSRYFMVSCIAVGMQIAGKAIQINPGGITTPAWLVFK